MVFFFIECSLAPAKMKTRKTDNKGIEPSPYPCYY